MAQFSLCISPGRLTLCGPLYLSSQFLATVDYRLQKLPMMVVGLPDGLDPRVTKKLPFSHARTRWSLVRLKGEEAVRQSASAIRGGGSGSGCRNLHLSLDPMNGSGAATKFLRRFEDARAGR
jgi:hypothetical protein